MLLCDKCKRHRKNPQSCCVFFNKLCKVKYWYCRWTQKRSRNISSLQVISLENLLQVIDNQEDVLCNILKTFCISNNTDVQHYLINTSLIHHKKHRSRTYLIFLLEEGNPPLLVAYYTLALHALSLPQKISKTQKHKLDGFNKEQCLFPCYLIAQMGRDDKYNSGVLSGAMLLDYAESTIMEINKSIGGRFILLECLAERQKLIDFYTRNNYQQLQNTLNKNDQNMVQFYKMI